MYYIKKQGDGHRGPEIDNDYASGINQIQGTSRSSRFQDMSAYLNNNAPASVLLDVTTR